MDNTTRYLPWVVVSLVACWLLAAAWPPGDPEGQMQLNAFGRLPVLDRGRVKPMDSLARISLMVISGKQTYLDDKGAPQPAVQWLLDVMTSGMKEPVMVSRKVKAFRIEDERLLAVLQLPRRRGSLYAAEDIAGPHYKSLQTEAQRLRQSTEPLTTAEEAFLNLDTQLKVYVTLARYETTHKVFRIENDQLRDLLGLEARSGYRYGFDEFVPRMYLLMRETDRARGVDEKQRTVFDDKVLELTKHVELYMGLASLGRDPLLGLAGRNREPLLVVPPESPRDEWRPYPQTQADLNSTTAKAFVMLLDRYAAGRPEEFNRALDSYSKLVDEKLPGQARRVSYETFFNHFAPFYVCAILYVFTFVLVFVGWLAFPQAGNRAAFWLGALTLAVHTVALLSRMYIQGRPPVTNLYSSAVFIGWGCLALALLLESIYRNGLGIMVASVLGSLTMFIAHYLGGDGDTLEMMVAVLDTNFWLATHVVCVTLGYTATFVAGFLGILFVVLGVFTQLLDRDRFRSLGQMIYGVICFATFLSFVGTVLGGIWADQSWGRFWGWDPKENGALLIVLMNALILHARWSGMVKQRGMAVLAIVGNMVTGWSWFGTNQLSVGLHNYGFNSKLALGLTIFWVSQLILIGIGLMPIRRWKSFGQAQTEPAKPVPAATPKRRDHKGIMSAGSPR